MREASIRSFTLKVAARCNLNCDYCYVFNAADSTWRSREAIMDDEVFGMTLERIREHVQEAGPSDVSITFHGGEPMLVGTDRFDRWCADIQKLAESLNITIHVRMQTNATLITRQWAKLLSAWGVHVGVSVDGPRYIHDAHRVDHAGRGSFDAVMRGLALLANEGIEFGILCVLPLGYDGPQLHKTLRSLGPGGISYLIPDVTHDSISNFIPKYGATPCADMLIPIFDEWWNNDTLSLTVQPFVGIARTILGGRSGMDIFGNEALRFVFVETDGAIEGLDVLKICSEGAAATGLNVREDSFNDLRYRLDVPSKVVFNDRNPPRDCAGCLELETCGGGYLPHRFKAGSGFDNRSAWCNDILKIFGHIRTALDVKPSETHRRRMILEPGGDEKG
jgi:uncharacterized protein